MSELQAFVSRVVENVEHVIVGKRDRIELLMVAILCRRACPG